MHNVKDVYNKITYCL